MPDSNAVFCIVGGDLRQARLANLLSHGGYEAHALLFEENMSLLDGNGGTLSDLEGSTVVVLPLPVTVDGVTINAPYSRQKLAVEDCLDLVPRKAVLLGGLVGEDTRRLAAQRGLVIADYLQREELAVRNAIPTAEGAVEIAMRELPVTIFESRCLVTGYGRVGSVLCRTLRALGARVTAAARRCGVLARIRSDGCGALPISQLPERIGDFDVVFNTVPASLFDEALLRGLNKDCLVIDLASKPGGVDMGAASRAGVRAIWALSLPGKVAPYTAGEIIADTIFNMLEERGGKL